MPDLELVAKTDVSSFRKIAIGTWHEGGDPSVYGTIEVNMDEAMRYLAEFRARTGRRLTISHMMAKVAAMALKEVPDANAVLRFHRIYSRVPILLALGSVRDSPVVRDGKVVVGKTMKVNATFDHRFIDGFHASVLSRVVRDWFEHPYERFDNLDQMPAAASKSAAAAAG
jgi:pyruvate/2-oxoglutarate dehydrogenase complex dihydrolipoamide acyltransferase (E2) component